MSLIVELSGSEGEGSEDNYEDGDIVLNIGQTFDTVDKCRQVLDNYAFQQGFLFKPIRNSYSRITRKCRADGCPWRIHASLLRARGGGGEFAIKTLNSQHTCQVATSPEIPLKRNRAQDVEALHEEVTITPDKVSSTPVARPQEPTSSSNHQGQKQNNKRKRAGAAHTAHASVPQDHVIDQTDNGQDHPVVDDHNAHLRSSAPDLPQVHVIDHTNNGQNHPAVEDPNVNMRSSAPDVDLTKILDAINDKYGDITQACPYESDYMKTLFALGICKVVQDLQSKSLKDIDVSMLESWYKDVRDAEKLNLNVQWLHKRLDEIKNAIRLVDDAKVLFDERNRRMKNILMKEEELKLRKVELKRIKSEIRDTKDQLAEERVMLEELDTDIGARESEYSRFQQHSSLMDGII